MYSEYLGKHLEAIEVLNEVSDGDERSSVMLEDQRAKILLAMGNYTDALTIWERILPGWHSASRNNYEDPVFSFRLAGIAAAKIERWDISAAFFLEGHNRSFLYSIFFAITSHFNLGNAYSG